MDVRAMREAARELAMLADRHAAQGETARRLHPDVLAALQRGPLLKAMLAPAQGGMGMTAAGMAETVAQVSRGCGSAGLCTAWYVGRVWMAALFPPAAFAAVLASEQPLVTDALAARGTLVTRDDGSLWLSGEWPFATGVADAQWLIATAEQQMPDGRVRQVSCLVPRAGFTLVPRWTAMGMQATGTDGVRVDGWRIEPEFTADFVELLEGRAGQHGDIVTRYPFDALAFIAMAACAVGMAERVYDEARRVLQQPPPAPAAGIRGQASRFPDIGAHFGRLRMAHASVTRMAEDLHALVESGNVPSVAARQGMRATAAEIIEQCVLGSVSVAAQSGTHAMQADSPVQRFVRDLIVLSSHIFIRADLARGGFREQLVRP